MVSRTRSANLINGAGVALFFNRRCLDASVVAAAMSHQAFSGAVSTVHLGRGPADHQAQHT